MYTAREVATVLGLSPGRLRAYVRSGTVAPQRGDKGELRFSFQDLVLLRRAEGLVTERIPPRRVAEALRKIRERFGQGVPLSGIHIAAEGRAVVVSDRGTKWDAASGQVIIDFAPTGLAPSPVSELRPPPKRPPPDEGTSALTAQEHYQIGCSLEDAKPAEAMEAYRRALDQDPRYADAHVNLGRLLHEDGDPFSALAHYRAALEARPDDGTAAFNLGVALEDLGRTAEAIETYQRAIELDPDNADAHYNVARLFEQSGKAEAAIRHLLVYRRLTKRRK
jgi:DNA-binding transcriptional MerR regulator